MNFRSRIVSVLIMTALASWSCSGDSTGPDADGCTPATTAVQATVSTGNAVTFDWSPACDVALLIVEDENGGDMWLVRSPDLSNGSPNLANRVFPRVTYGQTPTGMTAPSAASPLVAGQTYKLVLWRIVPIAPGQTLPSNCPTLFGDKCLVATQTFVR
jgi:hypothetical protein